MSEFLPPKKIIRPALKDPEWWTSIAVNLASLNLPSTVVDLGKFLKKEEVNVYRLAQLYNDSFIRCLETFEQSKMVLKT